jgi:hypothetical protein
MAAQLGLPSTLFSKSAPPNYGIATANADSLVCLTRNGFSPSEPCVIFDPSFVLPCSSSTETIRPIKIATKITVRYRVQPFAEFDSDVTHTWRARSFRGDDVTEIAQCWSQSCDSALKNGDHAGRRWGPFDAKRTKCRPLRSWRLSMRHGTT